MQIVRLIKPGHVDRVIAFDELPNDLINGIKTLSPDGWPRHWKRFLADVGSIKEENPVFFCLDYIFVNKDKERWQEIVNYSRRNCDASIRLLDKFEDMARDVAKDSYSEIYLEPEDIPVIKLAKIIVKNKEEIKIENKIEEEKKEEIKVENKIEEEKKDEVVLKKRGRPSKKSEVVMT